MSELPTTNAFTTIHFPQRLKLIKILRYVSFFINDVVLVGSFFVLFAWVTNFPTLKYFLFQKLAIVPSSSVLFILSGIVLLFGARRHILSMNDEKKEAYRLGSMLIPIVLAAVVALLSLVNWFSGNILLQLHAPFLVGLCFFSMGLALIPPFTKIPHRFHITQFFIFIVSGLSILVVLENIFALVTKIPIQNNLLPFPLALTFSFFCFGILLRWSSRGFFGNFTLDSTGSIFGFRVFLINLLLVPLTIFIIVTAMQKSSYNLYQMISIAIVILTFVSSFLLWINVKFLYKYELEHLLMRESLRTHNIDLTKEQETLRKQMIQIEQEKQQFKDKLTTQNAWQDAVDTSV